ncbi:hypothetical protein HK100_010056 [Physocladia obscura]|uniref:Uncharacterized protein n=1 Tax=Physocladia obscura TaxID=109957 RepID=A0AAD5T4H7_9FUNG|nr:hypothetical protein HK100_010056 [Physocladia obscura]
MSSDCTALATAFPNAGFTSSCCTQSGITCTNGRITELDMQCTTGGQSWIGSSFPTALSALSAVGIILFDDCGMTGELPDIFDSFPQLYELHISFPPPSWNSVGPRLNMGNHFSGQIPATLAKTSLLYFHAENNLFTGEVPQAFVDYIETGATVKNDCKGGSNGNFCYL